jgi:hypothetical protein
MTLSLERFKELAKNSGDLFLPERTKKFLYSYIIGSDNTLVYISYWSILHFISGIVCGVILLFSSNKSYKIRTTYYFIGLFIHTLWELWQKFIGMTKWDLRGVIDTVMDTAMFMGGMAAVDVINTRMI